MTDVPRDSLGMNDDDEAALDDLDEDENPDKRITERKADKYVEKNGELSDSEDEEMEEVNGRPSSRQRRIIQNYRHIMDVGGNDSGVETGSGVGTPQQASSLPDDADEMNVDDLDDKAVQTPSPPDEEVNGSAAVSGLQSPKAAIADDGDVEMGDADAVADPSADANGGVPADEPDAAPPVEEETITVQQQRTPPASPPTPQHEEPSPVPAPAPTDEPAPAPETTTDPDESNIVEVSVPPTTTAEPEATGATAEEAVIKQEVAGDDEVAKAQEEGRMEREAANAEAEAKTEAVAKAEADGNEAMDLSVGADADVDTTTEAGEGKPTAEGDKAGEAESTSTLVPET